jgi:hypothetical protein
LVAARIVDVNTLLHTGVDHPDLLWILAGAVVSFAIGITVGGYFLSAESETAAGPDETEHSP